LAAAGGSANANNLTTNGRIPILTGLAGRRRSPITDVYG
jgi:hypothetical protein